MALALEDKLSIAMIAAAAFIPLVAQDYLLGDAAIWLAYAVFAMSLAFIWGHCGLLSLGHAVFFGVGAYAMSLVSLGLLPGAPALISTWAGFAFAILAAAATAFVVGLLLFAAGGLKGAFFGVVTLALAVIAERLAVNSPWLGGMNGLLGVPPINLGLNGHGADLLDASAVYYVMLGVAASVLAGLRLVMGSRFGVALAGVRENELRIVTLGKDVRQLKIAAYTLSGAVAGLAGALFVVQFGFSSPSLIGLPLSIDVLIWVALGGRAKLLTAALGAILVRYIDSRFSGNLGAVWPLLLGCIFMLSVILFPDGIFGSMLKRLERGAAASAS
jgi:ABC-type branched-subunit amino acid transport system permease subunit